MKNKSIEQTLETSNATIKLNVTNATNNAKTLWSNEKQTIDGLQQSALLTTMELFKLRVTLFKNKQPAGRDAFKEYAVRQVLNFSGANLTDCEYYQAFKKKLDIVDFFYLKNTETLKKIEPTTEEIEKATLLIFNEYQSLNQAYKASKESNRLKTAERKAKAQTQAQSIHIEKICAPVSDDVLIATPDIFKNLEKRAIEFTALFKQAMRVDEKDALNACKTLLDVINDLNEEYDFIITKFDSKTEETEEKQAA